MNRIFLLFLLALPFSAQAQKATRNDMRQDRAVVIDQNRQDIADAQQEAIAKARAGKQDAIASKQNAAIKALSSKQDAAIKAASKAGTVAAAAVTTADAAKAATAATADNTAQDVATDAGNAEQDAVMAASAGKIESNTATLAQIEEEALTDRQFMATLIVAIMAMMVAIWLMQHRGSAKLQAVANLLVTRTERLEAHIAEATAHLKSRD